MNHTVGQIGYFQLSNLVRNKVPFSLFLINVDPSQQVVPDALKSEMEKLLALATSAKSQTVTDVVGGMSLRSDHPIVLICGDGNASEICSKSLADRGYINVFHVAGGWKSLLAEASGG